MTITLNPRKAAVALVAVVVLVGAYLIGTTHGGTAEAAAATLSAAPGSTGTASTLVSPGITVTGVGTVSGKPDTLRLDLGVSTTGPTVNEALNRANAAAAAVQKSLLDHGVAAKDLQTSGLSIQPDYTYPSSGTPTLRGYQVSESLAASLRDIGKAGDAIAGAVAAGGNAVRVNQISLSLEDTGALVSGARDQAFANAKAKADQYARASGRALGDAVTITESVQDPSVQQNYRAAMPAYAAASQVPIQAGSQDVNVTVTVTFGLR